MNDGIIDTLYQTILARMGEDPSTSYTASLFAKGTAKIAQKVGEEAVETAIEAIQGDKQKLAEESADLLYHLMVLWADQDLTPKDITDILQSRMGTSGIEEKNSRA